MLNFSKTVKRVDLPADQCGLDEDGWIEFRTRPTGHDGVKLAKIQNAGDNSESSLLDFWQVLVTSWSLKIDGEDIEFGGDATLNDLPLGCVTVFVGQALQEPSLASVIRLDGQPTASPPKGKKAVKRG